MATFIQIINLRLEINDPYGVINILSVNSKADLPSSPVPQTAYKILADSAYYKTETETDATLNDYQRIELQLSDSRIDDMINLYGEKKAINIALLAILKRIGSQFPIVRSQSGAESTEYQRLLDLYRFYKNLADDAKEQEQVDSGNMSGRMGRMRQPRIGGGNL